MRKMVVNIISLTLLITINSCSNVDYRREVIVDGTKGKFFISKTGTGIPLSADNDSVYYEYGSKKLRIFSGTSGKKLSLYFDESKKLLIIAYCNGKIDSIESSFTDSLSVEGNDWEIYRTQVINNPGFNYGSSQICS